MNKIILTITGLLITILSYGQTLELSNYSFHMGVTDTAQASVADSVYIKNTGNSPLVLDSLQGPAAPFSMVNAPANATNITAGDSIALHIHANRAMNPGLYQSDINLFTNDIDTTLKTSIQLTAAASAYTFNDVDYRIGSGNKTAMLVVDFNDSSSVESYAWGYHYSGQATIQDMLNDIAAADTNLDVQIAGGFLNEIHYNDQSGISGSPFYWSTWDGTDITDWSMNMGISTQLKDSAWFGCSYTDFAPALAPELPTSAHVLDTTFVFDDIDYWIGSGSKKTMLVIDFNDSTSTPSYAWGIRYDSIITGEELIRKVKKADTSFHSTIGAVILYDISYRNHEGIGGSPNHWSTWTGTNILDWKMNSGITDTIRNGQWFGCSYTDFSPALMPSAPVPAQAPSTGISRNKNAGLDIFPNPAMNKVQIHTPDNWKDGKLMIFNMQGQMVLSRHCSQKKVIDISAWKSGLYLVKMSDGVNIYSDKILKK